MTLTFAAVVPDAWRSVRHARLSANRSAVMHVLIARDGQPVARLDIHDTATSTFRAALAWRGWFVVGWAGSVHFVDQDTLEASSFQLESYFGHLYVENALLLVASASVLRCFDPSARLLWTAGDLGIDGVLVDRIEDGVVSGRGEWDPPGGWRPFRVSLATGVLL